MLLAVLYALPLFSTVIDSEGACRLIDSFLLAEGYIAVASVSPSWGGQYSLEMYSLDQYGFVTGSVSPGFQGEPVSAVELSGGVAVLCVDQIEGVSRVAYFGTSDNWVTEFPGAFTGSGVLEVCNDMLYIAGNDFPDDSPVRAACLDRWGAVVWNIEYPEINLDVHGLAVRGDELFVLAGTELPGWQCDLSLASLSEGIVYHFQPSPGRYTPVSLYCDDEGFCILANAVTPVKGMIGEAFLLKVDNSMNTEWTASIGGTSWFRATDMVVSESGFTVAGWTNSLFPSEENRSDLVMSHFSTSGNLEWIRNYGSDCPDYGLGIETAADGGYVVSGCQTGELYNGWILKTDSLGDLETQGVGSGTPCTFSVHPVMNPSSAGMLSVSITCGSSQLLDVRVYDIAGRLTAFRNMSAFPDEEMIIDFFDLEAGAYSILVESPMEKSVCRAAVTGGLQ